MKQYCRYCAFCISGDCYYCICHKKVLSNIKSVVACKNFALSELGDADTGKQYNPRRLKDKPLDQISFLGDGYENEYK